MRRLRVPLATPVILGAGAKKTVLDARKAAELFAQPDVPGRRVLSACRSSRGSRRCVHGSVSSATLAHWFVAYRLVLAALIVVGVIAGVL